MKIILVLSECPATQNSGGAAAGYDRALLLSEIASLGIIYIDWNCEMPDLAKLGVPTWGIVPRQMVRTKWARLKYKVLWLLSGTPWFYLGFDRADIARVIKNATNEFNPDFICFDNIPGTIAWDACKDFRRVYFAHNVEHEVVAYTSGASGFFPEMQKSRMYRHEMKVIKQANAIVFLTERDRRSLLQEVSQKLTEVVLPAFAKPLEGAADVVMADYVILPTNAGWLANKKSLDWFFYFVYPKVSPDVNFVITGRDNNGFLAGIAGKYENVRYAGLLDRSEYEEALRKARLFVNPTMYGSGFQIKMMEAIRFGVPVLSTFFSNHVGCEVESSDDPNTLASIINSCMLNDREVRRVDYVSMHIQEKKKLERILRSVLDAPE